MGDDSWGGGGYPRGVKASWRPDCRPIQDGVEWLIRLGRHATAYGSHVPAQTHCSFTKRQRAYAGDRTRARRDLFD